MASSIQARLQMQPRARRGETVEVQLLIQHPMEVGLRRNTDGTVVTRNVMPYLLVRYNGQTVFKADLGSGIAANPFLQFWVRAQETGPISAEWRDEAGVTGSVSRVLEVDF